MIETKSAPEVERQFEWLTSAVRRVGNEAQMRVANHLRAVTNGRHFLLPNYHTDPLISDADKSALYKRVFNALCALNGKPDWSLLQGQPGNGHPRVDPIDAQLIPPLREERPQVPACRHTDCRSRCCPAAPGGSRDSRGRCPGRRRSN